MKEGGGGHLLNPIPNMTKLEEKEKKEERKSSTLGGWMGDNSSILSWNCQKEKVHY